MNCIPVWHQRQKSRENRKKQQVSENPIKLDQQEHEKF